MYSWFNQWSYAQVVSTYGSGSFIEEFKRFSGDPKVITTKIENMDAIMQGIKDLFGRGN
jgi:hypothetical protein